jgi:hypothetical protein
MNRPWLDHRDSRTIDSRLGRASLVRTLSVGPLSFVTTYNSLVGSDMRVELPVIEAEIGKTGSAQD